MFHDMSHANPPQKQAFMLEQIVKQIVDGMPPSTKGLKVRYKINSKALQNEIYIEKKHESPNNVFIELEIPADNQLPFVNARFFDRFFQMIRIDEIVGLYSALLSEEKTILIVCEDTYELIPIVLTLMDLMHPFEWVLPKIPFLVSNPDHPNDNLFEMINNIQSIIIGIHHTAYEKVKYKMEDDPDNLPSIIVLDLSSRTNSSRPTT